MRRSLASLAVMMLAAPPLLSQVSDASGMSGPIARIEVNGFPAISVRRLSGLAEASTDVVEPHVGGQDQVRRKPGRARAGEIVLVVPLAGTSDEFAQWARRARDGRVERRPAIVTVIDRASGRPTARYRLHDTWPRTIEMPRMEAGHAAVAEETVHLAYDHMEMLPVDGDAKP